jgi:hypothetical protein
MRVAAGSSAERERRPRMSTQPETGIDKRLFIGGAFVGGVQDSGFGRVGVTAVRDEFTEMRRITVQRGSHPFPF